MNKGREERDEALCLFLPRTMIRSSIGGGGREQSKAKRKKIEKEGENRVTLKRASWFVTENWRFDTT